MTRLANAAGLSLSQAIELALLLEVTAPKVGNVHRGADFEDVSFVDFVTSAVACAPELSQAANVGVGRAVLKSIEATRRVCRTNTNLGMVLLFAPLAAAVGRMQSPDGRFPTLVTAVQDVLGALDASDSQDVYEAIRLAHPGGLGESKDMDVRNAPPESLLAAMRLAADRDLVARQYANGFGEVFDGVVPWIIEAMNESGSLCDAIVRAHVRAIATWGDSLIARKCGPEIAVQAQSFAHQTWTAGSIGAPEYLEALEDLDFWLRSDGHKRNPGATADLIAAGLFVAIWENKIAPPFG